jgi:hypothetical protein
LDLMAYPEIAPVRHELTHPIDEACALSGGQYRPDAPDAGGCDTHPCGSFRGNALGTAQQANALRRKLARERLRQADGPGTHRV